MELKCPGSSTCPESGKKKKMLLKVGSNSSRMSGVNSVGTTEIIIKES